MLILPPPSRTLQDWRAHQPIDNQPDLLRGTHLSLRLTIRTRLTRYQLHIAPLSVLVSCMLCCVALCCSENPSSPGLCNANIYIRQDHVILNTAQLQHHTTFTSISFSLYILFLQANTQSVSASTMYAIQFNANS